MEIKNYIGLTGTTPIRFIASDVDGTMANDAKEIPPEIFDAMRAARESGIRVAIASGRAWHEMGDVIERLPCIRYFICTNGAYVIDKDEQRELFHATCDKDRALGLVRKLMTYGVFVEAYVKAEIFGQYPAATSLSRAHMPGTLLAELDGIVVGEKNASISHTDTNTDSYLAAQAETLQAEYYFRPNIRPFIIKTRTMVPDLIAKLESLPEGPEKIQIFFGTDDVRQRICADLRDDYQGLQTDGDGRDRFYDLLESSEGNLEFVLPSTTKGTAVEALANHWGYDASEVMTVGDSENDLSMLRFAGASVAMGNALPHIKETARYETKDNNHFGLAEAIYSAIAYNRELDNRALNNR